MSTPPERIIVIESDIENRAVVIEYDIENRIAVIGSDGVSGGGLYPSPDLFPSPDLYPARAFPAAGRTGTIEKEDRDVIVICKPQHL